MAARRTVAGASGKHATAGGTRMTTSLMERVGGATSIATHDKGG